MNHDFASFEPILHDSFDVRRALGFQIHHPEEEFRTKREERFDKWALLQ